MTESDIDSINGRMQAMSLVLVQLLQALTPVQAARAALSLAIERESLQTEADPETPQVELQATDSMLGAYLDLLSAVSKHG